MSPNLLAPSPDGELGPAVPDKFLDPATGAVRLDVLLKSYQQLENRLSSQITVPSPDAPPEDWSRLRQALGVPADPEGYCIECAHGLFSPDADINNRLHAAGFNAEQAQLVYDLAADRLVPMLQDVVADMAADREMERLVAHFGGEERWRRVSRQLLDWGRHNLPGPALEALATTYDGVLALHRMMADGGGRIAPLREGEPAAMDEASLRGMMRDPRYWKQRDPRFIRQVTDGFRRLYADD
jgi:hypothetical protein